MSPPKQPPNFHLIEGASLTGFSGFPQLSSSIGWRVMVESVGEILAPNFWQVRESNGFKGLHQQNCLFSIPHQKPSCRISTKCGILLWKVPSIPE